MQTNIYKRKDGRFEGRIKLGKNPQGKNIYKSIYGNNYEECLKKLKKAIPQENKYLLLKYITYEDICNQWLIYSKTYLKESTIARYSYILNKYLLPEFGSYPLNILNSKNINDFINKLSIQKTHYNQKLMSPYTVNNIVVILKITLSFAERNFPIVNPTKNICKMKTSKKEHILSDKDWKHIRIYLRNDYSNTATAISIAVYMGMRIGEICALKRKDIDLKNKLLRVQRTVQRIQNKNTGKKTKLILGEPKSISSRRLIPIPDILLDRLYHICKNCQDDDFILGRTYQKVLDPRTLQYRFQKYLKIHDLEIVNFHQLRHKFAGNCIEKNFDVKSLSEILGHSNINITLNYYVHPTISFKRKQINMLFKD